MSEAFIYLLDWLADGHSYDRGAFVIVCLALLMWPIAEIGEGLGRIGKGKK